ncbi:hypothetical protein Hanom_Chr12g01159421 [Helianthus anomalus]
MRIDLPLEKSARSRPSYAFSLSRGILAACTKSKFLGFKASSFSSTAVYSLKDLTSLAHRVLFRLYLHILHLLFSDL